MNCRHCGAELAHVFVDLATAPPSNHYLSVSDLRASEKYYPLRVLICEKCLLVQTEDYRQANDLFRDDYAYFSSFSNSWLNHCKHYVSEVVERFGLGADSMVSEIAANDGYLLQYMKERGIPCYGVEPTIGTAEAARQKGIEVFCEFFGEELGKKMADSGRQADLMIANNVLAHVPDINDFVKGFSHLLKPSGVATFEFPHLYRLVTLGQFDTIYHEHYSYLSLTSVTKIFKTNGLRVFDVKELQTHGGSLRVFAERSDTGRHKQEQRVAEVLLHEKTAGMNEIGFYTGFQRCADQIKNDLLSFLLAARQNGLRVGAYGAAAKGNTLLNYAGVRADLLPYVVDKNPNKQGKYLPGSRIPIVDEAHLKTYRPDRVVILPWNLTDEISKQLSYIQSWGGRFVRAVPTLEEFI